jgi:hypothetical protein
MIQRIQAPFRIAVSFVIFAVCLTGGGLVKAAEVERTVHIPTATKVEPLAITKVALGGVTVQRGRWIKPASEPPDADTPFTAGDDWIENVTIYLLNRTNQSIVFFGLQFTFSDRPAYPLAICQVHLGKRPASAAFDRQGNPLPENSRAEAITIRPGQTFTVRLADSMRRIRADIEAVSSIASVNRVSLGLLPVDFAGGLQWNGGYEVFDPQASAWRSMGRDYFPGDMDGHWPGRPGWTDPQ